MSFKACMDAGSTALAAGLAGAGSAAGLAGADGGALAGGGVCACMPGAVNSIASRPAIGIFRTMTCLPRYERTVGAINRDCSLNHGGGLLDLGAMQTLKPTAPPVLPRHTDGIEIGPGANGQSGAGVELDRVLAIHRYCQRGAEARGTLPVVLP